MGSNNNTVPIIVSASLESLSIIGKFVKDAAEIAGLDKRVAYKLRLAVDEIATNIIMHGYGENNLSGDIVVSKDIRDDVLIVVLEDSGIAFDPRTRTMPTEEELAMPLEDRNIGGLGIFLTINGIDRFDYERVGEHNRNIFEVRRNTADGR